MVLKRPPALAIDTRDCEDEQPGFAKPDATASISIQSSCGDFKLYSKSFQEYKITEQGLHRTRKQRPASGGKFYQISDEHIEILHPLGEGASSTVYKAYFSTEGSYVAVKRINCLERALQSQFRRKQRSATEGEAESAFLQEKRRQIMNDIRGLCDVSHPSLVQFIGAYRMPDSAQISIVLEYMDGGSLADLLKRVGKVPEPVLSNLTAQVLQGLLYLHKSRHTVHRDIKPANILLSSSGRVKIADFGISAFVDNTLAVCNTFLGTVTYMSPERIDGRPYSFSADIWSLGLSLLECAVGQYPYDASAGPLVLMMQVLNEEVPLLEDGCWAPDFQDFLGQCLQKDPLERPTAEALLLHPFVTQNATHSTDLRSYLLSLDGDFDEARVGSAARASAARQQPAAEASVRETVERLMRSLSCSSSSDVASIAPLLCPEVVWVHEGVETAGKSTVLQRLRSLRELQVALGVCEMNVDTLEMQETEDGGGVLVLVCGHIVVSAAGPLGAALWGDTRTALFSQSLELRAGTSGSLSIARSIFRHL